MSNEILFFIEILLDFSLVLALYKVLGRTGVFAWICIMTVVANIQVVKTVGLFGMTATLGNPAYSSVFLATDILSEKCGKRSASLAVLLGFVSMIVMVSQMNLTLSYVPASCDFAQPGLQVLFGFLPRVVLGSLLAYALSQGYDVVSYHWIMKRLPETKYLWIRNNVSTIISQLLDTMVFTTIAFLGVYSAEVFWNIALTTFVFKLVGALLDTPFIYLAKMIVPRRRKFIGR